MPSEGSVTQWINQLQLGDSQAVHELWGRYFQRLVHLARKKLAEAPRQVADEEDVALSAFDSFCRHAEKGQFPDLADRESLWRLLVVLTARKAGHLRRDMTRLKRGGLQIAKSNEETEGLLGEILSREPDPAFATMAADEHRHLMSLLGADDLRQIAQLRLEGHSVEAISEQLGFAPRSVKRKLQLIRTTWEKELDE